MDDKIDSLLKESRVIHPTATTTAAAYVKDYEADYKASIADPEGFWEQRREGIGLVCALEARLAMGIPMGEMVRRGLL